MNELFRKYGKAILAVMGVALMLIWMYQPSSSGGNTEMAKEVQGTLKGKKITRGDLAHVHNDLQVLSKLASYLAPSFAGVPQDQSETYSLLVRFLKSTLNQEQSDVHFYLLIKEAQNYGLSPTGDDIRRLQSQLQMDAGVIQDFDKELEIQYSLLQEALGNYALVIKLESLAMGGMEPSLPEIEYLADQSVSRVTIRYHAFGVQEAKDLVAGMPEPTEAQIKAQFEAYKSEVPAAVTHQDPPVINGHAYPFGYKYPDRVKVEYLAFIRDDVIKTIHPGPKEWKAALEYYNTHQSEFTDKPAVDATGPQPLPRVKSFDEVKDELIKQEVEDAAAKLVDQMVKAAQASAGAPWKEVEEGGSGYHKLIDKARWVSYASLAAEIKQRFGYEPKVVTSEDWLNINALRSLPGIGEALVMTDNGPVADFATAALHVREIDAAPAQPWMRSLQVGVEGPVVFDGVRGNRAQRRYITNNAYMYRVTDASKTHEATAAEMPEVYAQAKADLLKLASYMEYQKRGEALAEEAGKSSLVAVAAKKEFSTEEAAFTRLSMYLEPVEIAGLGIQPKFADACFALAARSRLNEWAKVPATSGPATMARRGAPTGMIPIDTQLKAVVVEVTKYEPMPENTLDSQSQRYLYIYLTTSPKAQAFLAHWTHPNAVAERVGFVPTKAFGSGGSGE